MRIIDSFSNYVYRMVIDTFIDTVYNSRMNKISLALSTLYSDLNQRVHSRTIQPGSVFTMKVKGRKYIYVKRQIGRLRRDDYVGPADAPETLKTVELIKQAQEQAREDRKTISLLKKSGIPAPNTQLGRVLDSLSDAGVFADATLIGTAAYQCYSPIIGYALPRPTLMTNDAALATARLALTALPANETIHDVLMRADPTFLPVPALSSKIAPPSAFRSADGFMVDLVTQRRTRHDKTPVPLEGAGAGAVPLQFIRWLIADPIEAIVLHGSGVAVTVPLPARFAVHKLILAQERQKVDRAKRQKDLLQAEALIEALREADPFALQDALDDARSQGRNWVSKIKRSLSELKIALEDLA